jgi:hypothetical protein
MAQTVVTIKCMRERVIVMAITSCNLERDDSVNTLAAGRKGSDKT